MDYITRTRGFRRIKGAIRFHICAALSLGIHVAAVALLTIHSAPTMVAGAQDRLRIRLTSFEEPGDGLRKASATKLKPTKPTPHRVETKASPATLVVSADPVALPQAPSVRETVEDAVLPTDPARISAIDAREASAAAAEVLTRTRIRALLLDDVARRLVYPPLALERGWSGEVLLSLTVDPRGVLKHIHLVQSSGYEILDESALTTLRQIAQIADAQPWLNGSDMDLELPVIYRLHD